MKTAHFAVMPIGSGSHHWIDTATVSEMAAAVRKAMRLRDCSMITVARVTYEGPEEQETAMPLALLQRDNDSDVWRGFHGDAIALGLAPGELVEASRPDMRCGLCGAGNYTCEHWLGF